MRLRSVLAAFAASLVVLFAPLPSEAEQAPQRVPLRAEVEVLSPAAQGVVVAPASWDALGARLTYLQAIWDQAVAANQIKVHAKHVALGSHGRNESTEDCIRRVENHGSYARGSNPSHTGMYQFSYSTWVANGGNPDTWESASPAEQDQVFATTVSRNGYRDWTPYDPC